MLFRSLRRANGLSDADDGDLEGRNPEIGHLIHFVGGLECVEHRGQAQIEHAIENQDVNPHGNNDIKIGVIATSRIHETRASLVVFVS